MSDIEKYGETYKWVYEYKLWKKPGILFLILKIFFFICLGLSLIPFFSEIQRTAFLPALIVTGKFFIRLFCLMAVMTLIAYLIYGKIMGGKYIVVFTMDENGVTHTQLKEQYDKAAALGLIAASAGISSGNMSAAGSGLLAASRSSISSDFSTVKNIKASKLTHTIRINAPFCHNQVYTQKEDYDFVLGYIKSHLPENAKIRG